MRHQEYNHDKYHDLFIKKKINAEALKIALDNRKYEIENYWKRATYFWTFIAATLAGFIAVQTSSSSPAKTDISVLLCSLGIIFSFGWFCANKGSKYWQENWENHVNLLEDEIIGPLHKVVLHRNNRQNIIDFINQVLTGPLPVSVSKINHIISLYITIIWIGLLFYALPPFNIDAPINLYYVSLIILTAFTCIGFIFFSKTYT